MGEEEGPPILELGEEEVHERRFFLSMRNKVALSGLAFFSCMILLAAFSTMAHSKLGLTGEEELAAYVTLFRDDLDSLDPDWYVVEAGVGDVNSSDGYAFLNLGSGSSEPSQSSITDLLGEWRMKWSHVGLEIRLRCGDDNGLSSGVGEGVRCWGLADPCPGCANWLTFKSRSPASEQSLVGFWACVGINGSDVLQEDISHVDMREWHNYTILWMPSNATFLVDGEMVLTTEEVPKVPLAVLILTHNRRVDLGPDGRTTVWEWIPLKQDQWIQIDYVHVFMGREEKAQYSEAANQTLTAASRVLLSAELKGIDTQKLLEEHAQAVEALHQDGYIPAELSSRMVSIAETLPVYLEEMSDLFSRADEKIRSLFLEGGDTRVMEANYDRAKKALWDCDYSLSIAYLEKITEDDSD